MEHSVNYLIDLFNSELEMERILEQSEIKLLLFSNLVMHPHVRKSDQDALRIAVYI